MTTEARHPHAVFNCVCCEHPAAFNFDGSGAVVACADCGWQYRFSGNLIRAPFIEHAMARPTLMQQLYGTKELNKAINRLALVGSMAEGPQKEAQMEIAEQTYKKCCERIHQERVEAAGHDETVSGQTVDSNAQLRAEIEKLRAEAKAEREEWHRILKAREGQPPAPAPAAPGTEDRLGKLETLMAAIAAKVGV